jgi:hypothetical protein
MDSDVDVFIDKDKTRKLGFDEFMDILFCCRSGSAAKWITVRVKDCIRFFDPISSERPSGSSDLLRHECRRIDPEILWSIVIDHLSVLDRTVVALLKES